MSQPSSESEAERGDELDERSAEEQERAARMANRFDVRRIIGALFLVYGAVLTILGIVGSHAVKTKAAGIDIDLWAGLGMLAVGVLMITWALRAPVRPESSETRDQASGRPRSTPT